MAFPHSWYIAIAALNIEVTSRHISYSTCKREREDAERPDIAVYNGYYSIYDGVINVEFYTKVNIRDFVETQGERGHEEG
jgi:hypothetical protein